MRAGHRGRRRGARSRRAWPKKVWERNRDDDADREEHVTLPLSSEAARAGRRLLLSGRRVGVLHVNLRKTRRAVPSSGAGPRSAQCNHRDARSLGQRSTSHRVTAREALLWLVEGKQRHSEPIQAARRRLPNAMVEHQPPRRGRLWPPKIPYSCCTHTASMLFTFKKSAARR